MTLAGEAEALDIASQVLRLLGLKLSPRRLLQEVSKWKNGFSEEAWSIQAPARNTAGGCQNGSC